MRKKTKSTVSKKRKPKSKNSNFKIKDLQRKLAYDPSIFKIFTTSSKIPNLRVLKTGTSIFDETDDFDGHKRLKNEMYAAAYGGRKQLIHLITTEIAGAQFSGYAHVLSELPIGTKIQMILEPMNSNAIKLVFNGLKIGYIPKESNKILSALMRAGMKLYAVVLSRDPDASHIRKMIQIGIYMELR